MTASPVMLSRYATHDASAYPGLWRGCVGAWAPGLGVSGARIHDFSRRMGWATPDTYAGSAWVAERGAYGYDLTSGRYADSATIGPTGNKTGAFWVRNYGTLSGNYTGYCAISWGATQTGNAVYMNYDTDPLAGVTGWVFTQWGDSVGFSQAIDGLWHHVAFTNVGSLWSLYFDGVFKTSKTMTTNTQPGFIRLGAYNETPVRYQSKGMVLDDIRVYDRVLNAEEIRLLARYRGVAYTPRSRVLYAPETEAAAGVAKPVLFHSYYMSQGMRP